MNYSFDATILSTLIGGLSALDISGLNIQNLEEAKTFIRTYGYDVDNEIERSELWTFHRRAVTFMREELLREGEVIPEILSDPNQLKDLSYLLIYASTLDPRENSIQSWACAILKVMHVLVHLSNDLFNSYSSEIQEQVLKPFQAHIKSDPISGIKMVSSQSPEKIVLKKFDVKPFKTTYSSITKLLAKPEEVAFRVLDKMGVRFVTKNVFDSFRVMRFLVEHHLISFPHVIPNETSNTLYPLNIFLETMEGLTRDQKLKSAQVDKLLKEKLVVARERAEYRTKRNVFTSDEHRFIKFINRSRVQVEMESRNLTFFYPFEIQIVDYDSYLKNLSGPASHEKYKDRQRARARRRILGIKSTDSDRG